MVAMVAASATQGEAAYRRLEAQSEIDRVVFGDAASEAAHGFAGAEVSKVVPKGRIIDRAPDGFWRAGPIEATLAVDGASDNYVTLELCGDDISRGHLFMLVDGEMMGQMHLGEYDLLDYESCWPRGASREIADPEHPGVQTYRTFLLPRRATDGKKSVRIAIYSMGEIWGYGTYFAQFQKPAAEQSRTICSLNISQAAGRRFPMGTVTQSLASGGTPLPPAPLRDKIPAMAEQIDKSLHDLLIPGTLAMKKKDMAFVAEAFHTEGTRCYHDDAVAREIVAAVDDSVALWRAQPEKFFPKNGTWTCGRLEAEGVARLGAKALESWLTPERRKDWSDFFAACTDYLFTHRPFFANQTQIVAISCHWANRALKICDPSRGPALDETLHHLYQGMGLEPCPNGYVTLTASGLSKEDGYVGSYGEATISKAIESYEATQPYGEAAQGEAAQGEAASRRLNGGDPRLLAQLRKTIEARLPFRHPSIRRDGSRVMRLEAVTSWRNEHFPARPCYLTDGKFILTPWTLTGSDAMLAALELCEDDGWMAKFADLKGEDKPDLRERMRFVHDYPLFAKARAERNIAPGMPMTKERFFFCDPENAIVAEKDGEKILYIECHWRAREAPNGLAKIHYIAPDTEVQATVACEETFEVATTGGSGVPPLEKTGGSGVSPREKTTAKPKIRTVPDFFQYGWMPKLYDGYRERWTLPRNIRAGIELPISTRRLEPGALGARAETYRVDFGDYVCLVNDRQDGKDMTWRLGAGGSGVSPLEKTGGSGVSPLGKCNWRNVETGEIVKDGADVVLKAQTGALFVKE